MAEHPDVETDAERFVSLHSIDLGALVLDAREQVVVVAAEWVGGWEEQEQEGGDDPPAVAPQRSKSLYRRPAGQLVPNRSSKLFLCARCLAAVRECRGSDRLACHCETRAHLRQAGSHGLVVVKMDVEGAEYPMLRNLSLLHRLCSSVDFLLMEWHRSCHAPYRGEFFVVFTRTHKSDASAGLGRMAAPGVPPNFEASVAWLLEAEGCRCRVWHDCESE